MLFNTLTGNYEYSPIGRKNLQLTVQMQFSEKLQTFLRIFITFLESPLNFEHFEKKKKEPYGSNIFEVIDSQRDVYLHA